MTTAFEQEAFTGGVASLLQQMIAQLGPELVANPQLQEVLNRIVDEQMRQGMSAGNGQPAPGDGGLADLIGLGAGVPGDLGQARVSPGVVDYDEKISRERLLASADLYYIYMHERIGVFRVIYRLQELFRAGTLRISSGPGAFGLYRFDKRGILRYKQAERLQAYRRVLGYTNANPGANARPNPQFHGLFKHFIGETAKFWRDKRISEVIRERATDPTFGSIAIVRRAALDLRNNLKNSSYGWVNVMRIETSQALDEAFKILEAPDVREQFGAETPWDVLEMVLWQYDHQSVNASALNRMAVAGREILRWLAEPYVLRNNRTDFETLLYRIAEYAEEWISSDEGQRLSRPTPPPRNVYVQGPPPAGPRPEPVHARRAPATSYEVPG